ncbi:MAG: hypothetical protein MJE66_07960 [Proteobacteria bacterium]|nr:hypothetical protein [Pseudomonadota bacterium]
MLITSPKLIRRDDAQELSAELHLETPTAKSLRLWYRLPASVPAPPVLADPFLATLLVTALSLGEDLELEGPVSEPLLEAATRRLEPVFRCWGWAHGATKIRCPTVAAPDPEDDDGRGTACFFSGGVDSWYSALKRRDEIDRLFLVRGIDIAHDDDLHWRRALALTEGSAKQLERPLTVVETNVHVVGLAEVPQRLEALGRPLPTYSVDQFSGGMLVSVALVLRELASHVLVPASWTYERLAPAGSHWLIEPSWSTPHQSYEIEGGEATRLDKVRAIARWRPSALQRLRPCFASDRTDLNCGECEKCLRTLMAVRCCGGGDVVQGFAIPLDLERVARVYVPHYMRESWTTLLHAAGERGDRPAARAIRAAIRNSRPRRRTLARRLRKKLRRRWERLRLVPRRR